MTCCTPVVAGAPHKGDPLYGIRRLLLVGAERLDERGRSRIAAGLAAGDRFDEVGATWTAKELLRAVYGANGLAEARLALAAFYRWCAEVEVPEASRLAKTISAWEAEVLVYHTTGLSNGPTEAVTSPSRSSIESAMAFGATRTIGSGSSCAAASHGRLALPHESEAVNHAWSRRDTSRTTSASTPLRSAPPTSRWPGTSTGPRPDPRAGRCQSRRSRWRSAPDGGSWSRPPSRRHVPTGSEGCAVRAFTTNRDSNGVDPGPLGLFGRRP